MRTFNSTDKWQVCFSTDESNGDGSKGTSLAEGNTELDRSSRHACSYLVWAWDNEEENSSSNFQQESQMKGLSRSVSKWENWACGSSTNVSFTCSACSRPLTKKSSYAEGSRRHTETTWAKERRKSDLHSGRNVVLVLRALEVNEKSVVIATDTKKAWGGKKRQPWNLLGSRNQPQDLLLTVFNPRDNPEGEYATHLCAHVHVKAGMNAMYLLQTLSLYLIFWYKVSHWTRRSSVLLGWKANPRDLPTSVGSALGLQAYTPLHHAFFS